MSRMNPFTKEMTHVFILLNTHFLGGRLILSKFIIMKGEQGK